jgi:hypothetical protein
VRWKTCWRSINTTWANAFGGTLKVDQDSLFQGLLDWVQQAMEKIALLTSDPALTWEFMKNSAKLAFMILEDYANKAFVKIKGWASDAWSYISQAGERQKEDSRRPGQQSRWHGGCPQRTSPTAGDRSRTKRTCRGRRRDR